MTISNTRSVIFTSIAAAAIVLASASRPGLAQGDDAGLAKLTALEAELGRLEREIEILEATKAVKRLQRAYGYYLDKGLVDEIATLFSEDATAELGGFGVFVGKDRITELYRHLLGDGLREGQLNNHMILQGVVNVAPDASRANGRWRALIQLGEHGQSATWSEGPYENEYVKDPDGVWRISKLHWYMTLTAAYDPGWHMAPQPMPGPLEELPPDLPPTENYQAYPSPYLPLFHYDNPVSGRRTEEQP